MAKETAMFTTAISQSKATRLLKKMREGFREGKEVSAEEKLDVIQDIIAFSPRDWAADEELWLLYRVVMNDGSENESEDEPED